MFESMKKDKVKMITLIGMAVMIVAVAVKAATASVIAAAAIHIAGLACFFLIEGIEKTPDSESGLSFKRFFPDLKKPGVLLRCCSIRSFLFSEKRSNSARFLWGRA